LQGNRILVIEDDLSVREALASAMTEEGLRVDVAADGMDGLRRLRTGDRPAVILLDLRMPRLGGEDFLVALRADQRYADIPVISMTAGSNAPDGDAVVAHLRKPFDLDDLLGIVRSLCTVA
jgi:CheY-like chemotaxis protein